MSDEIVQAGLQAVQDAFRQGNSQHWLTLVGIKPDVLKEGLSQEDEETIVLYIGGMGDSAAWARGDFALYVRNKIKAAAINYEQYVQIWGNEIERLAKLFGVQAKTLYNNISTCQAWPLEHRLAGGHVRYKHHEAIPNALPLDERYELLLQAEQEGFSWSRLFAVAHGHALPDGGATATSKAHEPVVDADAAIACVDGEIDMDDQAVRSELEPDDFGDFDDDEGDGEIDEMFQRQQGTISVYLAEQAGNSVLAKDCNSELTFTFAFGNGSTYQVTPDLADNILRVRRIAS